MPPILKPHGSVFNARTITAPVAALVMAGLLYTYSVTSIRAAKRNAQLHREADGGQLDMRRESLRRHGVLEPVPQTGGVQLFRDVRAGGTEAGRSAAEENTANGRMGDKKARKLGEEQGMGMGMGRSRGPRTEVERVLEGYTGRGKAVQRLDGKRPEVSEE